MASLPVWMASRVVSTFLVCKAHGQHPRFAQAWRGRRAGGQAAGGGCLGVGVFLRVCMCVYGHVWAYLAIFQREDQRHLVPRNLLVRHLGGDPALGGVGLPRAGADVIDVSHGGRSQASLGAWRVPSKWRCGISGSRSSALRERGGMLDAQLALAVRPLAGASLCWRECSSSESAVGGAAGHRIRSIAWRRGERQWCGRKHANTCQHLIRLCLGCAKRPLTASTPLRRTDAHQGPKPTTCTAARQPSHNMHLLDAACE